MSAMGGFYLPIPLPALRADNLPSLGDLPDFAKCGLSTTPVTIDQSVRKLENCCLEHS
jgi:hypothetical protein